MSKLVFFIETITALVGDQLLFLDLATYVADNTDNEVFYINNLHKKDMEYCPKSALNIFDINQLDFSEFENAVFFTPINYLPYLLVRLRKVENAKIALYVYDNTAITRLLNQLKTGRNKVLDLLIETKSCIFADSKSYIAARKLGRHFEENYLDVKLPNKKIPVFEPKQLISQEEINVGFVGHNALKYTNALTNLANSLFDFATDKKINLHIIGCVNSLSQINISKYSPKIRFIYTGKLEYNDKIVYLRENVDVLVSNYRYAIEGALASVPVVLSPISDFMSLCNENTYLYLSDAEDHCYEYDRDALLPIRKKVQTIGRVVQEVYENQQKRKIAEDCYNHSVMVHSPEHNANKFLDFIQNSTLTLESCREITAIENLVDEFNQYEQSSGEISFSQFLDYKKDKKIGKFKKGIIKINFALKRIFSIAFLKSKMKKIVKCVVPDRILYSKFYKIQNSFKNKKRAIKKLYKTNGKIKVAFVVVFNSVFPTRPVFEKMLNDSVFEPYIIVVPNVSRSFKYQIDTYNEAFENLSKQYPGKVVHGYNENEDSYLDLKSEYSIIFFCNPYKHLVNPLHEIEYFLDKNVLTIYASYGFAALSFWDEVIALDFYNYLWKACVETNLNLQHLKLKQKIKGKNGVVTGYVKMDKLAEVSPQPSKRKTVLICPHHTVWGWKTLNISNFLQYSDFFVELPKLFPEVDFIFRPHPLLFANIKIHKIWTQQQVEQYLNRMLESPNIVYDKSGDYLQQFVNSDAMIHDCGSFIGEYLYTKKPCCYMMKSREEVNASLVPLGQECMKNYYHAFNKDEIVSFIKDVVINGNDPMKEQREHFVESELMVNYPNASEYTIDMIKKELKITNKKTDK